MLSGVAASHGGGPWKAALATKVLVMDVSNPSVPRDGDIGTWAREKGAGLATAELIPGAHLVRAFNASGWRDENITGWPAFTQAAPSAPPMRPEPIMPILSGALAEGCARPGTFREFREKPWRKPERLFAGEDFR